MAVEKITYRQLDRVLSQLGFILQHFHAKGRNWLYYEHPNEEFEIVVVEKKPAEFVSEPAILSARRQLIERGLVSEEELERMLAGTAKRRLSAAKE